MFRRLLYRNLKLVFKITSWNRNRFTPAGLLIVGGMFTSGIFGVDVRQSLAFYIFALTAALLLVAGMGTLIFRGRFRVRRLLPQYATVNQPLRYRIELENLGKSRQQDLLLIDELALSFPGFDEFSSSNDPDDRKRNRFDRVIGYPRLISLVRRKLGGTIKPVAAGSSPPGRSRYVEVVLNPLRRGHINFAKIRVCRSDPLGLLRAMKKYDKNDRLLVLPQTYIPPVIEFSGARKYQQGGMSLASAVGDSQEFMSLRDYQPGDPLRAIHWRSYAKTGTPVVKEFHDEFFVRQGLVLDSFKEHRSSRVFEEAISVAASFCLSLPGQDSLLDLMFVGEKAYRVTSGRGLAQAENILEMLACVSASDELEFTRLRNMVLQHCDETSGLIFILLCWDEKRQAMVENLVQRGVPVLVYLIMEEDEEDVEAGPMADYPDRLVPLHCGKIQQQLLSLSPARLDM